MERSVGCEHNTFVPLSKGRPFDTANKHWLSRVMSTSKIEHAERINVAEVSKPEQSASSEKSEQSLIPSHLLLRSMQYPSPQ